MGRWKWNVILNPGATKDPKKDKRLGVFHFFEYPSSQLMFRVHKCIRSYQKVDTEVTSLSKHNPIFKSLQISKMRIKIFFFLFVRINYSEEPCKIEDMNFHAAYLLLMTVRHWTAWINYSATTSLSNNTFLLEPFTRRTEHTQLRYRKLRLALL